MKHFLLFLGPLINLYSIVPYIVDITRKRTKPNRVTWFTWMLLTIVGTSAIFVQEGTMASLLPFSAVLATVSIVLLGFKFGYAKYTKFDVFCQVMAIVGLMLWAIFNSPMLALISVIAIDFMAALPTLLHSYRSPEEETWQTYAIGAVGSLITIAGLNLSSVAQIAYPIYLMLANGGIAAVIVITRIRKGLSLSRKAAEAGAIVK